MFDIWRRAWPLVLLLLVLLVVLLASAVETLKPLGQEVKEDGTQEIWGDTRVGQTFVPPFSGLAQVEVALGTGGRDNTKDLVFHLRTSPDATQDLVLAKINASTLSKDEWVTFEFPPLGDSGGQSFYFFLESPDSEPGDTLSVFRSRSDLYREGEYFLNGVPAKGDLAFTLRCRPSPLEWFAGLSRLLAQNKPSIWGEPACYGILFGGYLVLLLALFYHLEVLKSDEREPGLLEPDDET